MIPVAKAEQMRECDRITIAEIGIPGMVLMENASQAVAEQALKMLDGINKPRVQIYCGKGNNGGDGFAVARHLMQTDCRVDVYLHGDPAGLKGDAKANYDILTKLNANLYPIDLDNLPSTAHTSLIIDALLGTGFHGEVRADFAKIIEHINAAPSPILAIDTPSGVNSDTGNIGGVAVRAECTVTFGLIKRGLLIPPGRGYAGEIVLADIGIPSSVVGMQDITCFLIEQSDISSLLPRRSAFTHKGNVGHAFILAGSPGLTGAGVMAANAAMRTGAGLTIIGVPAGLNVIFESHLIEAMTVPLGADNAKWLDDTDYNSIAQKLEWADAVAFGPGIGTDAGTGRLLKKLIEQIDKPLVIDADGLNLLAKDPRLLKDLPEQTILTPHPGEFSRLTGLSTVEIASDPIEIVRKFAETWKTTIVLKGASSVVANADGRTFINSTGNAGMATGGSGDVLTGMIVSLCAQGLGTTEAAISGVWLHGFAGDKAAENKGQAGMVAGDIIDLIPGTITDTLDKA